MIMLSLLLYVREIIVYFKSNFDSSNTVVEESVEYGPYVCFVSPIVRPYSPTPSDWSDASSDFLFSGFVELDTDSEYVPYIEDETDDS